MRVTPKPLRVTAGLVWALAPFGGCALFPSFDDLSRASDAGKVEDGNRQDGTLPDRSVGTAPEGGEASTSIDSPLDAAGGEASGPLFDGPFDAADGEGSSSLSDAPPECDDAEPARCGVLCVDLKANADHCGACNHSCLGQPCVDSQCQPEILVNGLSKPFGISVIGESAQVFTIYWADYVAGTVSRLAAHGIDRQVDLQFVSGLSDPLGVIADPDNGDVYWTNFSPGSPTGAIEKWSQGNRTVVGTAAGPYALALDDSRVYWAYSGGPPCPDGGAGCVLPGGVAARNKDGTGGVLDLAESPGNAYGVAVDDSNVYVTDYAAGAILVTPKGTVAGAISCPSRRCLATGQDYPSGVAVKGGTLYWTNTGQNAASQGSVWHAETSGANPAAIVTARNAPFRIVADDSGVYWTEFGSDIGSTGDAGTSHVGGNIMRANFDGTGARSIYAAPPGECPHFIATDTVSVFWTDGCQGRVLRVAK